MNTRAASLLIAAPAVIQPWMARAQWLDRPTPGIPRTADGRANLSAPPPKSADGRPDLSDDPKAYNKPWTVSAVGSFRADNLHPQAKGYDIWGAAVKDKLAEGMQ